MQGGNYLRSISRSCHAVTTIIHYHDNPHNHRAMILPDEDRHRFDAPPEPSSNERWDEPEDYCDYIDTFTDDKPEPE